MGEREESAAKLLRVRIGARSTDGKRPPLTASLSLPSPLSSRFEEMPRILSEAPRSARRVPAC